MIIKSYQPMFSAFGHYSWVGAALSLMFRFSIIPLGPGTGFVLDTYDGIDAHISFLFQFMRVFVPFIEYRSRYLNEEMSED